MCKFGSAVLTFEPPKTSPSKMAFAEHACICFSMVSLQIYNIIIQLFGPHTVVVSKNVLADGKKMAVIIFSAFFQQAWGIFLHLHKQYAGITFEFWAWFKFNISIYPIHNEKIVFTTWKSFLKPDLLWNSVFTHHHPACSHPLSLLLRSVTVTWSSENTIIFPRNLFWTLHKPNNFIILNVMSNFGTSI